MRIGKITISAEYRIDEQFQNCSFLRQILVLQIIKNCTHFFIFQFVQFQKFPIWKIPKTVNF